MADETQGVGALLKLAERCERATGPDRQLDVHIAATVFPGRFDDARSAEIYRTHRGGYNCADREHLADVAPRVTASLDAAMTLVTEGAAVRLYHWPKQTEGDRACVLVEGGPETWAATPALALCAASLRARSQS